MFQLPCPERSPRRAEQDLVLRQPKLRTADQSSAPLCAAHGRLAWFNAPYAGGEFLTKPLTFAGKELAINFATSAAGGVRVELARMRPENRCLAARLTIQWSRSATSSNAWSVGNQAVISASMRASRFGCDS